MRAGDVVGGRFELTRLAGAGGMARVFRALDRETGAVVALKVLTDDGTEDKSRFAREARVLAELAHPGIVRYVAHGATADGDRWIAMEWLEGQDLGERLVSGPLPIAETIRLGRRVAEALGMAHRRGIVHRDVKPSNLLLCGDDVDRVKILDFGIARTGDAARRLTRTGMTMGTPGFMSPEQARGDRTIDARTDVFALGCVLYECLAGSPAFQAAHAVAMLGKILFEDPPSLRLPRPGDAAPAPEIPEALDALIARMLAKNPADRPDDGDAVARELAALASLEPQAPPEPSIRPRALGRAEQRIVSVVVATTAAPASSQVPTLPWTSPWSDALDRAAAEAPPTIETAPPTEIGLGPPAPPDRGRPGDPRLDRADAGSPAEARPPSPVDELRGVARVHGARVEQLADGTVVALMYGGGTPMEQAVRAARCALAMRRVLAGAPMVLATGRGVLDERYPVGEVIDRAVRALDEAPAGELFVDEATHRLLGTGFELRRVGGGYVLGGERGSPLALTDATLGGGTVLGKRTRCVGRERELALLTTSWDECVAESSAVAVVVTAPPGVGKSRLARELVRRVVQTAKRKTHIVQARGEPQSAQSAFGAIAPMLRRMAGIFEGELPAAGRAKLRQLIAHRVAPERIDWVAAFLGELVGVPFERHEGRQAAGAGVDERVRAELAAARADPATMSDQMRAAWLEWARSVVSVDPLLLVVEDLHWADLPTVQLVEAGLKSLRDMPLMVLALARPEVFDRFPRLWADRNVVAVQLGGLPRRAAEQLARELLGTEVEPRRIEELCEESDGNALYLEELIRAAAEGDQRELSPGVLGMVQARFDALDGEVRRTLRAASIFGHSFWSGGVAALLGAPPGADTAQPWLDELVQREIVYPERASVFPGETQYVFHHDLVRDAAYAMLTPADAALGHRLAGEWLAAKGERDPVVLADHFERGGDRARAAVRWRQAAEEALAAGDLDAVVAHTSRGLAAGADGEAAGTLRLLAADAQLWRGDFAAAERAADAALPAFPAGSAPFFRAVGDLVYAGAPLRKNAELARWADRLLATEPVDHDAAGERIAALCRTGIQLEIVGEHPRAQDVAVAAQKAAANAQPLDAIVAGRLAQLRGFTELSEDDLGAALEAQLQAAAFYDLAGATRHRSFQLTQASFVLIELGQWTRGERILREALDEAEAAGVRYHAAIARTNLAYCQLRRGDVDDALTSRSQAVVSLRQLPDLRGAAIARAYLSRILAAGGDIAGAEREAREAAADLVAYPPFRACTLGAHGDALLAQGRAAEALLATTEGMRLLDGLGALLLGEAALRLAHVRALRATGDHEAARLALAVARDRIHGRARRIRDPELAKSFVEEVPENRDTLAGG